MHTREFFYDNYKNHPEATLKRLTGEYSKLNPHAQEALRDVLRERKMDELLASLTVQEEKKKKDLSHLNADEVRELINKRLSAGESPEIIKMDLRSKGVNLYEMSMQESRNEENIERRFMELQSEGKSKAEIDAKLKVEFNLDKEHAAKIPERMRGTGAGLIVAGGVMLMVGLPFLAVVMQEHGARRGDVKIPFLLVGAGVALLAWGIQKRRAAAKFLREAEKKP
jgi:hypothetical protein